MGLVDLLKGSGVFQDYVKAAQAFLTSRFPQNKYFANLIQAYEAERLVLVLGAGVSLEHGLPDWNTLLQKLLLSTVRSDNEDPEDSIRFARLFTKVFSPDPLIAARYLYNHYTKSNPEDPLAFDRAIQTALYETIDDEKETALLTEIRHLCIAAGKTPNIDSVISYNFDDLLESYLGRSKVELSFQPTFKAGMTNRSDLVIQHTHGYLPRHGDLTGDNQVTLSEKSYHQQYTDIYGWSNLVQIDKFKDKTCLFIGVSFTDPNTRRLLDIAKSLRGTDDVCHYRFNKRYDLHKIQQKLLLISNEEKKGLDKLESAELEKLAKVLTTTMERFEEEDAASFGVGTLWVQEFHEIPALLAKIRRMDTSPLIPNRDQAAEQRSEPKRAPSARSGSEGPTRRGAGGRARSRGSTPPAKPSRGPSRAGKTRAPRTAD